MRIVRVERIASPSGADESSYYAVWRQAPARTLLEWLRPRVELATVRWDTDFYDPGRQRAGAARWIGSDDTFCCPEISEAVRRERIREARAASNGEGRWVPATRALPVRSSAGAES